MIVFQTFIKDGQKAAAALDSVTDHVEEKETEASTASKSQIRWILKQLVFRHWKFAQSKPEGQAGRGN